MDITDYSKVPVIEYTVYRYSVVDIIIASVGEAPLSCLAACCSQVAINDFKAVITIRFPLTECVKAVAGRRYMCVVS